MFDLVCLIDLPDANQAELIGALKALGGAAAPVMEGNFNGGSVAARFSFADRSAYQAVRPRIDKALDDTGATRCNWACFEELRGGVSAPALATGVWRGLLLCADRPLAPARMEQFEAEMALMPKYIRAIRNWRLSRAVESGGDLNWTHVWEQEYEDIGGLMGPYMIHPYHWALIDRWFDPECPDWISNTNLCHSFAMFGEAVLS